jgi:predicted nucleotidyltransferase
MATTKRPTRQPAPRRNAPLSLSEARQIIRLASQQHGAKNVRIFGSFARGTQRRTSDIDLLVVMEEGRTLLDIIALEQSLTKRLGRRIDILTERSLSPHLRDRILSEARPLCEKMQALKMVSMLPPLGR